MAAQVMLLMVIGRKKSKILFPSLSRIWVSLLEN